MENLILNNTEINNMNLEQLETEFAALGLRLELQGGDVPGQGLVTGALYKPTPHAKWKKEKCIYGYTFKSEAQRLEHLNKQLNLIKESIKAEETEKQERKARELQEAEDVQVGDVFHSSWGFDQSNCDFYQVVEKPSKNTVVLAEIAFETVKSTGWASEEVRPVKDAFLDKETIKKRLTGKWVKFSSYRAASKIDLTENRTYHRSWYY
jgi:hypothetical protein